ncbi:hypothetical protein Krac_11700 [Ktedonobacter racemifer DSM 44963]|uniref:Uncharacterized protein n=1 Tax=Ktedonobacter racemifer DSM 44963 TaxID=485913 RepID=D6TD41_KTERA|nr:hypothetical protein Krac_11700 [Ktedonobacter racemifer DSM 44963]
MLFSYTMTKRAGGHTRRTSARKLAMTRASSYGLQQKSNSFLTVF